MGEKGGESSLEVRKRGGQLISRCCHVKQQQEVYAALVKFTQNVENV